MRYSAAKLLFIIVFLFYFLDNSSISLLNAKNNKNTDTTSESFTANNDSVEMTVPDESSITIDALDNDEGNDLKIREVGSPSHGSTWSSGTNIVYQPAWNFIGTDSFTYKISEGWSSSSMQTATVTVTVNGPPEPHAEDITLNTEPRTQVSTTIPFKSWQSFSYYRFSPSHGDAWANDTTITYQPYWNYQGGTDSFIYGIQDIYGRTSTGTVTVNVGSSAPTANDDTVTADFGETSTVDVLSNDTGSDISLDSIGTPSNNAGTAVTSGDNIIFTPTNNFFGETNISYTIKDTAGQTASATLTINVNPPPEPEATDDSVTTNYGEPITVNVVSNDIGLGLSLDSIGTPSNNAGTAVIADNSITFTPAEKFFGETSISYTIKDIADQTSSASLTINVAAPSAPKVSDDSATTNYGESVTIDVLSNDTGTDLYIENVATPSHGSAKISENNIIYTPEEGFSGSDQFTYTVKDIAGQEAEGSVSVEVGTAQGQGMSISSDPILSNMNHSMIDGIKIKYLYSGTYNASTVVIRPHEKNAIIMLDGKSYILTKNTNYTFTAETGKITVVLTGDTYQHRPMQFSGGEVSISPMPEPAIEISAENDIYELDSENTWYDLSVLDNDTGQGTLKIASIDSEPEHGKAKIDDKTLIRYKFDKGYTGIDSFTYTMYDECDRYATAEITIYCGVPKINAVDDKAVTESGSAVTIPVLQNDTGKNIKIKSVTTPSNGEAKISGENIIYTPTQDFEGTVTFSYTIEDEYGIEATANITVEVGSGSGEETGPLRQAIYKAVIDSLADIDVSFDADSFDDADAMPPIKLLLYKEVFNDLTDTASDFYLGENKLEVSAEERAWLQKNIRDNISNLFDLRMDIEDSSDSSDAEQKINSLDSIQDNLITKLKSWRDENPGDSVYDESNY